MTPIEAKQLKRWLDDNGAIMTASVELGSYVVMIRNYRNIAFGESKDDFEAAIREAQHLFDEQVIRAAKRATRVVGEA
jgi:hypothetical protein